MKNLASKNSKKLLQNYIFFKRSWIVKLGGDLLQEEEFVERAKNLTPILDLAQQTCVTIVTDVEIDSVGVELVEPLSTSINDVLVGLLPPTTPSKEGIAWASSE